jgi:hypothetical protein
MSEAEIKVLGRQFEIGGHTLTHARLKNLSEQKVYEEVNGCYLWLAELLEVTPVSFCFPGGVYNKATIKQAVDAGFNVLRTTELLSVKPVAGGLTPTTLQVYEHKRSTYLKHLVKRMKVDNFLGWLKTMASSDLLYLVDCYIEKIDREGGCMHIWGHSWEIEQFDLWQKLELLFKQIANLSSFQYVLNKNLLLDDARQTN